MKMDVMFKQHFVYVMVISCGMTYNVIKDSIHRYLCHSLMTMFVETMT